MSSAGEIFLWTRSADVDLIESQSRMRTNAMKIQAAMGNNYGIEPPQTSPNMS